MNRRSSIEKKTRPLYKPEPGDLVFAKVKGYPPWPARVESHPPEGIKLASGRFPVYFFGTYESAVVSLTDLFPYGQYKDKLGKQKKHRSFNVGMHEIEQESTDHANNENDESECLDNEKMAVDRVAPDDDKSFQEDGRKLEDDPTIEPVPTIKYEQVDEGTDSQAASWMTSDPEELESEPELLIDDKKTKQTKSRRSTGRQSNKSESSSRKSQKKKQPIKTSRQSLENVVEQPQLTMNQLQAPESYTSAPIERSRSGRMIKRKRLDDFEENDFSFLERKRRSISSKADEIAQEITKNDDDASSSDTDDKSYLLTNQPDVDKTTEIKDGDSNDSKASASDGGLSEGNSDSIDSTNKDESDTIDIRSEEKRNKLKLKLEQKELEKEKRKIEKLEQKRLEKLEKWRTIVVTSDVLKEIETEIIDSLNIHNTNINRCLHVLNKLDLMPITQKSLLAYKAIVQTLRKCRKYKDERVRQKSELLYNKFKSLVINDNEETTTKTSNGSTKTDTESVADEIEDQKRLEEVQTLMNDLLVKLL